MKRLRTVLLVMVALEALYLVTANVALSSGLIPWAVSRATPMVRLKWDHAHSLWPGHVTVSGFTMQLDEGNTVQLDLAVDHSTADISLTSLLQRRVRIDGARASGVSYRMSARVTAATALASPRRVAAFPVVDGYDFPPLRPDELPPDLTAEQIDGLWGVELGDVVAEMRELWLFEYRYLGRAHVAGSFALEPMKQLWVGPATVSFEGGTLSAGPHVLSSRFDATVRATIAPVDLRDAAAVPIALLGALTARLRCQTELDDLAVAELYLDGVTVRGAGTVSISLDTVAGRLTRESRLEVKLDGLEVKVKGFAFDGRAALEATGTPADRLVVSSTLSGRLGTPPLDDGSLVFTVSDAVAELLLDTTNLAAPPAFSNLSARVGDATADDVRPLTLAAGRYVPIIAPSVLGDGPLVSSATATVTPEYTLLRLKAASLGAANLTGALLRSSEGFSGAASGHFGLMPLGLVVTRGELTYFPFIADDWLNVELGKAGIQPAEYVVR